MPYEPNFNDPRTRARMKRAMGFACAVMSETKPHPWSTRYIDKYFGMATNPLSQYLRNTLLICTDDYYKFNVPGERGICKKYILNKQGVDSLMGQLKINTTSYYPIVIQVAQTDHNKELESGQFEYKDLSNRLWHPLQRYRKQHRTQILSDHGYLHDYDIECAAPTLIHQYAQHLGMDLYLFALNKYLTDRTEIRNELAHELELDPAAIKEIINALFCGAVISNNKDHSDIYQILNGDLARIEFLKQHKFINELISDIKTCWEYITPTLSRRRNAKTNRLIKITCQQKWNVYFELERVIITSVRRYLDKREVKYFLIHDGWTCESEIDRNELCEYVRNQTGFDVKFDYMKLTQPVYYPIVIHLLKGE